LVHAARAAAAKLHQSCMVPLRILIADDHELYRRGVRSVLAGRNDCQVCGEAENGQEAVEKTRELKPDLVILDITMPVLNGLDAARQIKAFSPDTLILILSMHSTKEYMEGVNPIGVCGYVEKGRAGDGLMKAIDAILEGRTSAPPES
jgi:DNA-binding NarL/FixJ family response regulator